MWFVLKNASKIVDIENQFSLNRKFMLNWYFLDILHSTRTDHINKFNKCSINIMDSVRHIFIGMNLNVLTYCNTNLNAAHVEIAQCLNDISINKAFIKENCFIA